MGINETKYIEQGVYVYGKTILLFEGGAFNMFGWECPLKPRAGQEGQTFIDSKKIGKLLFTLPISDT